MIRSFSHWAIALSAIAMVVCFTPRVQADDYQVGYHGNNASVGYHYDAPMDYHHTGRAYFGSTYNASPYTTYRYGFTAPNYYSGRAYIQGPSAYQSSYGYGYGSNYDSLGGWRNRQPVYRPTWYSGLTRRSLDTGQTTTWSPVGYGVGNYYGYNTGNYCAPQQQQYPAYQWRSMSTSETDRRQSSGCRDHEKQPCDCDKAHKDDHHKRRDHYEKRDDHGDRRPRWKQREERREHRDHDKWDRDEREDREDAREHREEMRERHERRREEMRERHEERREEMRNRRPRGDASEMPERRHVEIGSPGLYEWMEPEPQTVPVGPEDRVEVRRHERVDSDGWQLLRDGDLEQARDWFSQRVMNDGNDAELKVGYALSSAATGGLATGVWAMRRGMVLDADVLDGIEVDDELEGLVRDLIHEYTYASSSVISESDMAYMAASLHYMIGDYSHASKALDRALDRGDDSRSTIQLKALIDNKRW